MQKSIGLLLISLICIVVILVTGCTNSGSSPASVTTPAPTTTLAASITATTPAPASVATTQAATTSPSITPTTVSTVMISTTEPPKNDIIKVTLNSAKKRTTSYSGGSLTPGVVILELDITIQNYDKQKDFEYTDSSFVLSNNLGESPQTSKTTVWAKAITNPFIGAPVPSGSPKEGKIVFFVADTSNNYKLSIVDSTGTVLTSINNINVP